MEYGFPSAIDQYFIAKIRFYVFQLMAQKTTSIVKSGAAGQNNISYIYAACFVMMTQKVTGINITWLVLFQ